MEFTSPHSYSSNTMGIIEMESFFEKIDVVPSNLTFALIKAFEDDKDPQKVNLLVGAYRTNENKPYVLPVVKKTEEIIVTSPDMSHEYLPSHGLPTFIKCAVEYLLGKDSPALIENRAHGIQTISGSGALYLGALFLNNVLKYKRIYLSDPTWENHSRIFGRAGFTEINSYRYFNTKTCGVDINGMLDDLDNAPDGSVVLLHTCAHNPTGCDPTRQQWISIANVVERKNHFVFFDSAYQGFASGDVDGDAFAVRHFVTRGFELLCAQSFSKIFGLYGERVGNLTIVHRNRSTVPVVMQQLTTIAFDTYLVPPRHGALIVQTILSDEELYAEWLENLNVMSTRMKSVRRSLYNELIRLETPGSWNHIVDQIGMFSFTGLNENQVRFLTDEFHVYLRKTGRISLCGLNDSNVEYVAKAIHAAVTKIS